MTFPWRRACVAVALSAAGVAPAHANAPLGPSLDELWNRAVDTQQSYRPEISPPSWIAPGPGLPSRVALRPSNNNIALTAHGGRLFIAWRTADTHFASGGCRMYVLSTARPGTRWTLEAEIALGTDVREPFLLSVGTRLFLYFVELGTNAREFTPRGLWRMERLGPGRWTEKVRWGGPHEVAWDFKVRRGRVWMTSYRGERYRPGRPNVELRFRWSHDGIDWRDTEAPASVVYRGGVSEASFEFDGRDRLWAVTRNEEGDDSEFGSHMATAPAARPWEWAFPERASPLRYDSPRLFRHGNDLYLIARRDPESAFDEGWRRWPQAFRRLVLLASYSLRPKRTTLYRVDTDARRLEPLLDLPSAGDTAFPSIARLGPHEFLVANYTSPLDRPGASWIEGQVSSRGTAVYVVMLRFRPTAS